MRKVAGAEEAKRGWSEEQRERGVAGAAHSGSGRSFAFEEEACVSLYNVALHKEGVWRSHLVTSFESTA